MCVLLNLRNIQVLLLLLLFLFTKFQCLIQNECIWVNGEPLCMCRKYLMNFLLKFLSFRSISQGANETFFFNFRFSYLYTYSGSLFFIFALKRCVCVCVFLIRLGLCCFWGPFLLYSHIFVENVEKFPPKWLTSGIINPVKMSTNNLS